MQLLVIKFHLIQALLVGSVRIGRQATGRDVLYLRSFGDGDDATSLIFDRTCESSFTERQPLGKSGPDIYLNEFRASILVIGGI